MIVELQFPTGQCCRLPHPGRQLRLVEFGVLVEVNPARVLALGRATGRGGMQRSPSEESDLDVFREAMDAEEVALVLDAVKWRVPPHGLLHAGHFALDERIEALAEGVLPAGHRGDICLHRGVAIALRDLRVAAGK